MNMARPRQIGALVGGKRIDLSGQLKARTIDGKSAYTCSLETKLPGDYVVFVEPEPYWEAAEGKMIVHYTKVVIDALGAESGWDALVGLAGGDRTAGAAVWAVDGQHVPRHRPLSAASRCRSPASRSSTTTRAGG